MTQPAVRKIRSYGQLIEFLREVRDENNWSNEAIDHLCGLPPGYAGKILSPSHLGCGARGNSRVIGPASFHIFEAFGYDVILQFNPQKFAQYAPRMTLRLIPVQTASMTGSMRQQMSRITPETAVFYARKRAAALSS